MSDPISSSAIIVTVPILFTSDTKFVKLVYRTIKPPKISMIMALKYSAHLAGIIGSYDSHPDNSVLSIGIDDGASIDEMGLTAVCQLLNQGSITIDAGQLVSVWKCTHFMEMNDVQLEMIEQVSSIGNLIQLATSVNFRENSEIKEELVRRIVYVYFASRAPPYEITDELAEMFIDNQILNRTQVISQTAKLRRHIHRIPKIRQIDVTIDFDKEPLGEGHSASVYEGSCGNLPVAVKVWDDGENESEIKMVWRLEQQKIPNVGRCFGKTFLPSCQFGLVMELLQTEDTCGYWKNRSDQCKIGILIQVAIALHRLHGLGIVHRDINFNNVLLDQSGQPKICDFGESQKIDPISEEKKLAEMIEGEIEALKMLYEPMWPNDEPQVITRMREKIEKKEFKSMDEIRLHLETS